MARKKRATQRQMIERARGRARSIEKQGLYSKALEDLKIRAEQQGLKNPFTQAKLSPEAKQRQMNIINQFLRASTSKVSGAKRERERSLTAIAKRRGYELAEDKKERAKQLKSIERNLRKERKELDRDINTVTELWNSLKYDLMDVAYESAKSEVSANDSKKSKKPKLFGGDVLALIDEIDEAGGLPVDFASDIFQELHEYLKGDEPPTYSKLWHILHQYDNGNPESEEIDNEIL